MEKREAFLKKARQQTAEALRSRDVLLAQVSRSIDDLNKIINLLHERLQEMANPYFPEIVGKDSRKYSGDVVAFDGATAQEKELKPEDLETYKELAQEILQLHQLLEKYESHQQQLAQDICPNIAHVAGVDIAAKLIAHVGSLSRLATMPASAIQVLGAEKALFKHLRNRKIAPPKHGIIFQHPWISSSPKKVRGKIARALANKIALAAKADGFTKRFIAEDLKKKLDARYQEIMGQYQKGKEK
ncbi:MAG TPA: NOP5/NOP56 family protein [Candidatus Bilamarchaeaceae archaeon]|nr:NOP5/NOP56 family protein [Candidatus Bilamarchaeaceae archaeon]